MTWRQEAFAMMCRGERGPIEVKVSGWVREPFAIDERENRTGLSTIKRTGKVWCITHLPTGHAVRFVIGSLALAQKLADDLLAAADWTFTDASEGQTRGPAVAEVMKVNPRAFVTSSDAGPPVPVLSKSESIS